ncbi:MAG: electron transport complex subunit RsxC [Treponema sp.]|jgi:electron transport complex protein RnfC|nr:electron transport complex subunit RsxC [Treponema sp.]
MWKKAPVLSFKRGIYPNEQKQYTENVPINYLLPTAGSEVIFPVLMHLGAPCKPLVEKGQKVLVGEKIADSEAFVCAPIHSSVSGTVKEIRPHLTVVGTIVNSIIIENDGELTEHESIKKRESYDDLSREQILQIIREAGIVGLGGAGFPTHVKLSPPPEKKIDSVIVNGCECEPYLTTDNRVMIEESDRIVTGLKIILKVIQNARGFIAVENNKPEAIESLEKACAGNPNIKVVVLKTKYPQGCEKQLVNAITKREVPSGGIPIDVGCVVNNVDTVIAIHRTIFRGRPLMRKVVTLTGGAIRNPGNYKARIGTKLNDLVELAGGFKSNPEKIVVGGPMMGTAIFDTDVPIVKTTSGVLFLTEEEAHIPPERNCIRCGSCVEHCPTGLIPTELNADILKEDGEAFVKHNGLDCIECGSCSYICPAKRRLSQAIRTIRRVELAKLKSKSG